MPSPKLFMLLIGAMPPGRNTEQHDVFFAIGETLKDLIPAINNFWPEAVGRIHIDAWREVNYVDGYKVEVVDRDIDKNYYSADKLFFINLGGYQHGLFDEPHFKFITVKSSKALAINEAKNTRFFAEVNFPGAYSHIDDKFGVDVDDIYEIADILPQEEKNKYSISINKAEAVLEDELHLGYFKLSTL